MTKRLLSFFNTYLFTFLLLPLVAAFIPVSSVAQSAGDVAFVGFNADGGDDFAVVLLTPFSASDEIHFSSQEWDGSDFAGSGGDLTWVAPGGGTSAGTVLVFNDVGSTPTVNIGSITDDADMNLSGSGDVIYAYTSTDKTTGPFTFLGAIGTSSDVYDGTDGTLTNTGLAEGTTAISLTSNIDVAEFTGDRSGNTANGYRTELNNIGNNWQEENGNGDQSGLVLPFSTTSFTILSFPTLAFTVSSVDFSEDAGSVQLTVELVESNSTAVDVDVVYLSSSGTTTNGDDFSTYSTQTVSFANTDTDGTTKTVSVTLTDDSDFEGPETTVFQLQNNTTGSIISPDILTLTIIDNDAPDVVINEILFDPNGTGGDANGDGIPDDGSGDEFVEFVNNESSPIDISNWTVSDAVGVKYTFPEGTIIPANTAFVVFAAPAEGTIFGGAYLYSAGSLGLNNGSDDIILKDGDGTTVVSHSYSSGGTDESITRNPDITGGFTDHKAADSGDDSSPFSPGTQIDGTAFGSATYAIGIRGSEGWRMISSPTSSTTFSDLLGDLWTQGATNSDDPSGGDTQYSWTETEGGSYTSISNMSNTMTPGQGYIVYVFEDDEFSTLGTQGGFPKTISTDNTENSGTVSIGVSANDDDGSGSIDGNEGWNLLGNPFGTDISVTALLDALDDVNVNVNANISIWNPDSDSYETVTSGDRIAPFQAFFVRYTVDGVNSDVDFIRSSLAANKGTDFFKQTNNKFAFNLNLGDENFSDKYTVEFSQYGTTELDRYDAYKLFSLNPNAINLYSLAGNNKLLKNVLPERLEGIIEIPLAFDAPNRDELTFRWDGLEEIPQYWDVTLIDRTLGRELDLRRESAYTFTFQQDAQQKSFGEEEKLYKKTPVENGDVRFVLRINPGQIVNNGNTNIPSSNQLNPNYPNPFNPTTTISYSLTKETQVKISVWNIVGQKVATLVDGVVEAGTHTELWNANDMPSGIYIAQMEVGGNVYIRKMTLIK